MKPPSPLLTFLACIVLSLPHHAFAKQTKPKTLRDKTLVAWVTLATLDQRGGSVLTIDDHAGGFDGIVFGELTPRKWMAGSEFYRRSQREQSAVPEEKAASNELAQVAVSYRGRAVTVYRNGVEISRYTVESPYEFDLRTAAAVFGLRHILAGDRACFAGEIEDARIYAEPLTPEVLRSLTPNKLTGPRPIAWWDFEGRKINDRIGTFPPGRLTGGAMLRNGRLLLPGKGSFMTAEHPIVVSRPAQDWYTWHVSALPEEGVAVPYDANGCIYWKGRYHLMYIYQDPTLPNGGHCWGHLSSTDLINWTFHPPALRPEPGEKETGIFSGNAYINKEGKPMLCWFGVDAGVCVATAEDDDLIHWKKHPNNPIIPMPKEGEPGHGVYTVWDPYLWLEGDTYYCLLGGNTLSNGKDTLYLCRSKDMVNWTPLHPFYEHPDLTWTESGEDCSCPDFFKMGEYHVLLCISHKIGARAYVGKLQGEKFIPEKHVRMNWPGGTFFAPESLLTPDGRRIFWAWVTDPRVRPTQNATGSGVQSMPREMRLTKDGTLTVHPLAELQKLRRKPRTLDAMPIPADGSVLLKDVGGLRSETELELELGTAKEVGVKVRCAPDDSEETGIWYNVEQGTLRIEMARSTLRTDVTYGQPPFASYGMQKASENGMPFQKVEAPFRLDPGETLRLRIFQDGPMLEVFANDRICLTQQIYPSKAESVLMRAASHGGTASVKHVEGWEMAPAKFINHKNAVLTK